MLHRHFLFYHPKIRYVLTGWDVIQIIFLHHQGHFKVKLALQIFKNIFAGLPGREEPGRLLLHWVSDGGSENSGRDTVPSHCLLFPGADDTLKGNHSEMLDPRLSYALWIDDNIFTDSTIIKLLRCFAEGLHRDWVCFQGLELFWHTYVYFKAV